jgi:teichuronic acid biosynthesis glycosyltransferase TuaC
MNKQDCGARPPAEWERPRAMAAGDDHCQMRGAGSPKVVCLSSTYPNPSEPGLGLFVQRRLQHLQKLMDVQVVAPYALIRYANEPGKRFRFRQSLCPLQRRDGNLPVFHPRWFYPPFGGILNSVWLFVQSVGYFSRLRKTFSFDLLDTHFGYPDGIAGALLSIALRVPFTMTFRGSEPKHAYTRLGRILMGWAVRRAALVFTVSDRLREFAIGLGGESDRIKTIPNGIDASQFFPRDRIACRKELGLPLDRPLIVSAGALVERKGHHRIIRALKALPARDPAPHVVIAGGNGPEGQYATQLHELVRRLDMADAVRFLGPVAPENIPKLMSAADLLCLASTNEGWPNVVHEALACGVPVVATDVGAVPEMLDQGRYGIIAPVNDGPALARALDEALRRNWDRDAISAWGRARTWHQVACEVATEMRTILDTEKTARQRL